MNPVRLIAILLLAAVVVILSVANRHAVTFSLAPAPVQIDIPLYLLLFITFLLGMLAGGTAIAMSKMRKWQRTRQKARAQAADEARQAAEQARDEAPLTEALPAQKPKIDLRLGSNRGAT